jgi:hypothetical protein
MLEPTIEAATRRPSASSTPAALPPSTTTCLTGASVRISTPLALQALAMAWVMAPMPPIAWPQAPFLPFTSPKVWCSIT